MPPPPAQTELSGIRKAAILLVLLGDSVASCICDHLPQESLRALAEEISSLGDIPDETANLVLKEYQSMAGPKKAVIQGGPEYAEKVLLKSSAPNGTKTAVHEIIASSKTSSQALEVVRTAPPDRLAAALKEELPQTIALILLHIDGKAAGTALSLLPEESRAQAVGRLAPMKASSPELVSKILTTFARKLRTETAAAEPVRREVGGVKVVADLLNQTPGKVTTQILDSIEKENGDLAASIRNQMFTFEDFIKIPDEGIRELLAQVDKKALATALKIATDELQAHFFKSMSSRAVEMLKEDTEALGNLRAKDIAKAEAEIVAVARKLESEGKLVLRDNEEEENA
jgi:flagellar motor switch protein FliG